MKPSSPVLLYRDNPEWKDIQPKPVYEEGLYPFAPIAFSNEYMDAMAYYVTSKEETSERLLDLTTHLLTLNPALYCVWHTRRRLLFEMNYDLNQELELVSNLLMDSPKNFQMWHHRRILVERLADPSYEQTFLKDIFHQDAKNYHAWNYLQWLVKAFNLWSTQVSFVNELLNEDVRNHSAWSFRYFLLEHEHLTREEEIEYTLNQIQKAVSNESAWIYLQGIEQFIGSSQPKAIEFAETLKTKGSVSPYLASYLVDVYSNQKKWDSALKLCYELQNQLDPTRSLYWSYRIQRCIQQSK